MHPFVVLHGGLKGGANFDVANLPDLFVREAAESELQERKQLTSCDARWHLLGHGSEGTCRPESGCGEGENVARNRTAARMQGVAGLRRGEGA